MKMGIQGHIMHRNSYWTTVLPQNMQISPLLEPRLDLSKSMTEHDTPWFSIRIQWNRQNLVRSQMKFTQFHPWKNGLFWENQFVILLLPFLFLPWRKAISWAEASSRHWPLTLSFPLSAIYLSFVSNAYVPRSLCICPTFPLHPS